MYLDTSYNSTSTVLSNIYTSFLETATKMWTYARCLPITKQPGTKLLIKTITDLVEMAYALIKSKGRAKKGAELGYKCAVTKIQVQFMALNAFRVVLRRRQSKYGGVLAWLDRGVTLLEDKDKEGLSRMKGVVSDNVV